MGNWGNADGSSQGTGATPAVAMAQVQFDDRESTGVWTDER